MTGSLQEKKGKYYVVLNFKDEMGARKQKWISTGYDVKGNKKKAMNILNDMLQKYEGVNTDISFNTLFCDFITTWVEINKPNIQKTTYCGYVSMVEKHIYPYFKSHNILLYEIKPIDLQKYYTCKIEEGLSPNTVIKHHALIRTSLAYAVKNGMLRSNAAELVNRPKKNRYDADHYTIDELNELLFAVRKTKIETPVRFAVFYGLRRSEILGLKWSSINFDKRTITIENKIVRVKDSSGKTVAVPESKLKSETSRRTLPLCDEMIDYLKSVKLTTVRNKLLLGSEYNDEYCEYVCVNEAGNLLNPDYVTSTFGKILKKNNMRHIRFHDLRHSCATMLLSIGYSMKEIQNWLGHADYTITANTYTHVGNQEKINMINSVERVLNTGTGRLA